MNALKKRLLEFSSAAEWVKREGERVDDMWIMMWGSKYSLNTLLEVKRVDNGMLWRHMWKGRGEGGWHVMVLTDYSQCDRWDIAFVSSNNDEDTHVNHYMRLQILDTVWIRCTEVKSLDKMWGIKQSQCAGCFPSALWWKTHVQRKGEGIDNMQLTQCQA